MVRVFRNPILNEFLRPSIESLQYVTRIVGDVGPGLAIGALLMDLHRGGTKARNAIGRGLTNCPLRSRMRQQTTIIAASLGA
jgi:hypothetical protein